MATAQLREQPAQEKLKVQHPPLCDLKINGVRPFYSHGGASERLAEAYRLLTMLRSAHDVCEAAEPAIADAFDNVRHEIQGRALEGIGTLIALAQYHLDCADSDRRQRSAQHG